MIASLTSGAIIDLAPLCAPHTLSALLTDHTAPARAKRVEVIAVLASQGLSAYDIGRLLRTDTASIRRTAALHSVALSAAAPISYQPSTSLHSRIGRMLPRGGEKRGDGKAADGGGAGRGVRRLRLVEDRRPDHKAGRPGLERRRADCVALSGCELEWIAAMGAKAARCEDGCPDYERRAWR